MTRPLGEFSLGFRISKEAYEDIMAPPKPLTRRDKLRWWWRYTVVWRISHAWDALIHGTCGYE